MLLDVVDRCTVPRSFCFVRDCCYNGGMNTTDLTASVDLDLSGLTCPLPLLKAKQALNKLESGQVVKVVATDPGSERDFQVFAEQSGNRLLEFRRAGGQFHYWLQKK